MRLWQKKKKNLCVLCVFVPFVNDFPVGKTRDALMKSVTLNDTHAIAIGAGILGTGGGGSTYLNRLRLERELRQNGGALPIISADDVPDDALVCAVGGMGAPTVSNEKLQEGREISRAVRAMEEHLRQPILAIVIGEIGGGNALGPLVTALQLGLPAIDGDSMGRAFPELQMDTFMIYGLSPAPFALADTHGNVAIFPRIGSPLEAEAFARSLTIEMGGSAALVMPVMNGADLKRTIIRDTLSLAKRIGETTLDCRARNIPPAEVIARLCNGRVLFTGKIVDVERRTVQGFARGKLKIAPFRSEEPPPDSTGGPRGVDSTGANGRVTASPLRRDLKGGRNGRTANRLPKRKSHRAAGWRSAVRCAGFDHDCQPG